MASFIRESDEEAEVNYAASASNNMEPGKGTLDATKKGSEATQLAVVPLHPACKKQKLEAKQLPIVLGRTNLASWWWKSCPCQHYCRLHCRPVAQNIRSLSKVMLQIDTSGRIHMCGKNPHLVTIIPERDDRYLQVNDIISIGRRDREPWMRLQVVEKPNRKQQPPRKLKTHTPEWMTRQNEHSRHHHHSKSSTHNNNASANNNVAVAAQSNVANQSSNNNNYHSRSHHNSQGSNHHASSNNLPEWITTTRKRKTSRRTASKPSFSNIGDNSDSPPRKRGRRSDKRQRRNNSKTDESDRNAPLLEERDHHPQVHLVFQDYETSATLLKGLQRKKRRSSSRKGEDNSNSARSSNSFLTERGRLKMLSKNCAALQNEVPSPPTDDSEQDAKPAASENRLVVQPDSVPDRIPEEDVLPETQPAMHKPKVLAMEDGDNDKSISVADDAVEAARSQNQTLSLLSLQQCASSEESEQYAKGESQRVEQASYPEPPNTNAASGADTEVAQAQHPATMDLEQWKEMIKKEEANGAGSSFRHALASIVVAKNEKQGTEPGSSLWLPPILGDSAEWKSRSQGKEEI